MDLDFYKSELCLTDNAPIRLLSARGLRITCTAGLVWLTVEGEADDIFLAPGQSHLVRGRGLGLLEAIGSGQVRFDKTGRPIWVPLFVGVLRLWHGWHPRRAATTTCRPSSPPSIRRRRSCTSRRSDTRSKDARCRWPSSAAWRMRVQPR